MRKRLALLAACFAVLFVVTRAKADDWDKKTTLTFSQPVELPGVTLPAGTYVFKLAGVPGTRSVVQVFNEDENQVYATILAIPNIHRKAHDKPYIGFEERPAGTPMAIREWFYPGEANGLEFVYPKARAHELAKEFQLPVLAAEVKPLQTPAEIEEAPVLEVTPQNEEVAVADTFDFNEVPEIANAAPGPFTGAPTAVSELPQTASSLPLIALAGLLSLSLAGAVRLLIRVKA